MENILKFLKSSKDKEKKKELAAKLKASLSFDVPNLEEGHFPKLIKYRTKRPCEKEMFPRRKKARKPRENFTSQTFIDQLFRDCEEKSVRDEVWCEMLALEQVNTFTVFDIVATKPAAKKAQFLQKFEAAKLLWDCNKCHGFKLEDIFSNYVECDSCKLWYHQSCVGYQEALEDSSLIWKCDMCVD